MKRAQRDIRNALNWLVLVPVLAACTGRELNVGTGPKIELTIAESTNKDSVVEGGSVTFTMVVTNLGPIAATNVTGGDTLPSGLIYVSSTASGSTTYATTGVWTIGDLAVNAADTLTLTATVAAGTRGTFLTNRAAVLAFETDSNLANNIAAASVRSLATAPTQLAFTTQPPSTASGAAFLAAVTVRDSAGNKASGYTGNVSVGLTAGTGAVGAHLSGTTTVAAVAGVATFGSLSIDSAANGYTLSTGAAGLIGANSAAFNVTSVATQLAFTTQPVSTTAGAAVSVVVAAKDGQGNTVSSYVGPITVAITGGTGKAGAHLNGTATRNAVAGVATFSSLSIDSAGAGYTLTATTLGLTSATSSTFNIAVGAAAQLAFTAQPSNTTAGSGFGVALTALDGQGNKVTGYSGNVTVAITGGTGKAGAHLSGTASVAAVAGVATFSGLSVDSAGNGYTLTGSASGLSNAASAAFNVAVGAASQLVFTTQPANGIQGSTFTVVVKGKDSQGNTVPAYTGSVSLAITGGTGTAGAHLTGTATRSAVSGVATFGGMGIDSVGTGYTLTASASAMTSGTSVAFNIAAVGPTTEPPDPGSGYLWADNFDRYTSVASMDAGGCVSGDEGFNANPGNQSGFAFYGQLTDAGVNTVQEACNPTSTNPRYALITGRSGSGKALRSNVTGGIGETGVGWRSPNNPRSIGNYTGKLVMQYWFRLSAGAPAGPVGYKWFMMWYKNDPNSSRVEIGIVGAPLAQWSPNSGMFDGNSAPFGYQALGPFWDHTPSGQPAQVNDGQWHRWTVMYNPNTTYVLGGLPASSRDGIIRVWVDGIKIIDVSASGVAAGLSTNIDLDKISPFQIDHFTFPGTLNDPPANFTIDMDDFKVWTVP